MEEHLFVFLAEGVATGHVRYREGARHSLMIFARGGALDDARQLAISLASDGGWKFVDVKRGSEVGDPDLIEDATLAAAADEARQTGGAIVVYSDEIPTDS